MFQPRSKGFTTPPDNDFALKALTLKFWDFSKPSVVAVNGLAVGGAANIALANYHDIVLSSTEGKFKYPFADLGLTPELGSSYMMPYLVGMTRAKVMRILKFLLWLLLISNSHYFYCVCCSFR